MKRFHHQRYQKTTREDVDHAASRVVGDETQKI